ncbi:aminotransferase class I/II-fold pyridoxal phosphate-dependent enzyme [Evansella sp. LMS18]|uniref:aminotransferase class I/II-fold pyridoxal phosphate-dependent enzyme n=1 Tax=Evansella sp. LMS18 TaxID=2924033 RepID=UPI0020D1F434|nr:aminotransferase class I/II-fold pyridoxal phosphate-dependent enzyme [Evansella sp. LMS18]UTR11761.1 aminotransferase class I/II-fold pyridoxal phosphate-dependent enzyme [Evansella sp. LMS18]
MKHLINPRISNIEVSGIRMIVNRTLHMEDVINLTFGQPDFPTPEYIKEAGISAIKNNHTSYTENDGILELRSATAEYMQKHYSLNYNPHDEILMTTGASEGLDIAFRTILTEGCEVILPGPVYVGYEPFIKLAGAVPVFADITKSDFRMTADVIEKYLTEKTRCVVLSSPGNPTGAVLTNREICEISELLRDKDIFVISDEVYSALVYEGEHYSIAAAPGMKNKTIVVNALSKSHAMTGWRIGFNLAPAYLTEEMYKLHAFQAVCASSMSQQAALSALRESSQREVAGMRESYKRRKDFVYNRLKAMNLEVIEPQGAFYVFPSIKYTGLTSMDFAMDLLERERVAVIPGVAFSELGEGYFRISFAQSMAELEEGMDRVERYLTSLKTSVVS